MLKRDIGSDKCREWGRENERWRFEFSDAVHVREHALGDPTYIDPITLQHFDNSIPSANPNDFCEIDPSYLHEDDWRFIFAQRWKHKENILLTEGEASFGGFIINYPA